MTRTRSALNNSALLDYLQEARVHFLLTGRPVMGRLLEGGRPVAARRRATTPGLSLTALRFRLAALDAGLAGCGRRCRAGRSARPIRSGSVSSGVV